MKAMMAVLAGLGLAGAAVAAPSPKEIVERHEAATARSDVDAMMADYADGAVVLQASRTLEGKPAIRRLFETMFPKDRPGVKIEVERIWEEGNVGLVTWHVGATHGLDQFVIKDGKIVTQAVFINEAVPAGR